MSFKNKFDNFWYYYKNHIIITLIAILLLSYFYFTSRGNKSSEFNIVLLTSYNIFNDTQIKKDLDDLIILDKNKKEVKISFLPYDVNDPNSQSSIMSFQAFIVWTVANDVDILISDKDTIKQFSIDDQGNDSNYFVSFNEYELDSIKSIENGSKEKIGLCLNDMPKQNNIDFYGKDLYISIVSSGKNIDKADKIINYFLN